MNIEMRRISLDWRVENVFLGKMLVVLGPWDGMDPMWQLRVKWS
jgi:hypothetical protein